MTDVNLDIEDGYSVDSQHNMRVMHFFYNLVRHDYGQ